MRDISDDPAIRPLLTQMGIPEDHVVYGMAALGYPANPGNGYKEGGEVVFVE